MSIEDYLQSVSFVNDTEEEFSSEAEETDVVVEFSNSAYGEFFSVVSETSKNLQVRCFFSFEENVSSGLYNSCRDGHVSG